MSNGNTSSSALDKLIAQLTSPLDWIGAIVGGVAGSVVSAHMLGLDFGHSILVGAGGGVTATKSGKLAFRCLGIKQKADRFSKLLADAKETQFAADLQVYRTLWNAKVLSNDDFEKSMEGIRKELTKKLINRNKPAIDDPLD